MLYIWLGVIVALILIEIFSRNLTASCFIASAIVSCVLCAIFHEEYTLQVGTFLVLGVFMLPLVILEIVKCYRMSNVSKRKTKAKYFKYI